MLIVEGKNFGFGICERELRMLISKCGPRLSESASEKLRNQYVVMRNGTSIYEREVGKKTAIPITVR